MNSNQKSLEHSISRMYFRTLKVTRRPKLSSRQTIISLLSLKLSVKRKPLSLQRPLIPKNAKIVIRMTTVNKEKLFKLKSKCKYS